MKMTLISKNKLCFIDGSISRPSKYDRSFPAWNQCNNMVLSWLLNAVSPSIAQSVICLDNASDVWKDLLDRFSTGDSF